MSEEEGEEVETRPRGRPNAWFVEHGGEGYGGNFRAVPSPHGGTKHVSTEDILGDIDTCWCGLPADHDWAGKSEGRKHPRKVDGVTAVKAEQEKPRLERRDITGFHKDLQDIMLAAVNEFGVRYRLGAGNAGAILLYAPDGSPPMRVSPRKADSGFAPTLRRWFIQHVSQDEARAKKAFNSLVADPGKVLPALEVAQEDAIRRLAEMVNGPEHPIPEKPAEDPVPTPADVAKKAQPAPPADVQVPESEWVTYINHDGNPDDRYQQQDQPDGTKRYRCRHCVGTDKHYETAHSRGLGGHWRTRHVDDDFWGKEVSAKRVEGNRLTRLRADVQAGLELIANAVGMETGDTDKIRTLEKQVAEYKKKYLDIATLLTEAEHERDEYKAKIEIMKEAMGL